MNIWDSVQRGLEKASHEAARIARTQRLRATIDTLSRQIQTQQSSLIQKSMELFANGQLTQSELLPICQSLASMQQQLAQAQNELKQIPGQGQTGPAATPPGPSGAYPPPTTPFMGSYSGTGENIAPTIYAPLPPVQSTTPIPVPPPPPPPGVDTVVSQQQTKIMSDDGHMAVEKTICVYCHTEVLSGHAYCQNCGAPVKAEGSYLPTIRGTLNEQPTVEDSRTVRTPEGNTQQDVATVRADSVNNVNSADQTNPDTTMTPNPPITQDGGY